MTIGTSLPVEALSALPLESQMPSGPMPVVHLETLKPGSM
jgi:hypothetical protein